ncbi:MAG: aldo/keto reductase [Betaproteobacteria bacterium RIFCSPLOWO2_02_FULL_66_14]|nr:MAG: aldo/keto reductase [Betaproteobacteria bacterium RIFCSPLOWO2_02_FULL_66_14]
MAFGYYSASWIECVDHGRRAAIVRLGVLASGLVVNPARAEETPLVTRAIPSTRELLPVIGLGTWQVFDAGADPVRRAALREALAAFAQGGGRVIDSAPMYGSSESVLGELAAGLSLESHLFLATKIWTRGRDAGVRQMEESLSRLRATRIDLMQVHNLLDVGTHARTLAEWKAEGRARYIGVTHYLASAHAEVERLIVEGSFDFVQINYSLAEPEAERRLLPLARERGVAVIANRPFAEGALFSQVRGKPLPEWAKEIGAATWAQYFLKWIVAHPAVTCAIPGTARADHLRDNLAAGRGPLPDAAMRRRMRAELGLQ